MTLKIKSLRKGGQRKTTNDPLVIAGRTYSSRLLVGTGKYKDLEETRRAVEASGAQIVTIAVRRTNIGQNPNEPNLTDVLPPTKYTYLPNTAGCFNAEDAIRTCRLARELLDGHDLVKLELLGSEKTLYADIPQTLSAAETLIKDGFKVMVYTNDDPIVARKFAEMGCVAVMPLASLLTTSVLFAYWGLFTWMPAYLARPLEAGGAGLGVVKSSAWMVPMQIVYAKLLGEKIKKHNVKCWLVNTGWTGGPYGIGSRMKIQYTRAMLNAALDGKLNNVEYETDPIFNLQVPKTCDGVPSEVLNSRNTWKDKKAYDEMAKKLAGMFVNNFKEYEAETEKEIAAAGPKV